jgi:integrase/recombinase XerD
MDLQATLEASMTPDAANLSRQYADLLRANGRSERTIDNYLYSLNGFVKFLAERPLTGASAEDIVAYQVQIAAGGKSDSSVRVATYALRGFFRQVLERTDWNYAKLPRPRRPKRLPEVLSAEEVEAILDAAPSPKYRAAFMLCYGSGLRTAEVVHLEPRHIDSQRMLIRVEQGKGKKDRQVMLCDRLLEELRACWKRYRPVRFLIEGKRPGHPIAATSIQRAFRAACRKTGIAKPVTPRSLRHAFATHLVERGTNLRVVQTLLGHQSLNTTAIYTHLARTWLAGVSSPLDSLKDKPKAPKA